MNEKAKKVARAGSIMVRINGKFYEVPDVTLFKSYEYEDGFGRDIYISGIRKEGIGFKTNYIYTFKFIEENRYEDVPANLVEKFLKLRHRKLVIDNEEYDIPENMITDCKVQLAKISKYNVKALKDLKEAYKSFLFKG